jgi:hypothetical protein
MRFVEPSAHFSSFSDCCCWCFCFIFVEVFSANYCLRKNIIPSNFDFATRKKLKVIRKRYLAEEKFRESNLFNHQFYSEATVIFT